MSLLMQLGMMMAGGAGPVVGHRYWRVAIDSVGGTNVSLGEIAFLALDGSIYPTASGTASASASLAGNGAGNAFNGDGAATFWASGAPAPQWVQYDFASAAPDVHGVSITARSDTGANEAPSSFRLQWSDDGSAWTDAQAYTGIASWDAANHRMFHELGYRYWRMYVTRIGNMSQRDFAMGALGYLGRVGDAATTAYTRQNNTATSSNLAPGQPITHLFADLTGAIDTNANTFDDLGLSPTGPWWVTVDMKAGSKFVPRELFVYPQPHSPENTDRAPVDFVLQGSDDNGTWHDYKTITGLSRAWTIATEYRVSLVP